MFNQGLSLDQAPPITVVMRFFLSVPFFGILLSGLILFYPNEILTPSHPISLSAIHLLFLGVITMSMIGALFQMQSVLGGKAIPSPFGNALIIHTFMTLGIVALAGAFITQTASLFVIASVILGSGIVYLVFLILPLLFNAVQHDTLRGMRLSLLSLFVTAILGIVMATAYAEGNFSLYHTALRAVHYSFGLIGWIAALIIAVAFQVIEMFYVTSAYSDWCKRNVFRIIPSLLVLKALWLFSALPFASLFDTALAALLMGFFATTLRRLQTRKRRVSDVSIWFWYFSMAMLLLSLLAHMSYLWSAQENLETIALQTFAFFALSVILGMITKIVPFLVWFHLNAAGYMETPIMSNVIPASLNKTIFALLVFNVGATLLGTLYPILFQIAGAGFLLLFVLLGYNLVRAMRLYHTIRRTGTRFEFAETL